MALYSKQIDNYIGGVSQQAYNLRYANQFEEQINCVSSVVNGLIKRPPTEFISYAEAGNINVTTHSYSRGSEPEENFLFNVIQDLDTNNVTLYATDLNGLQYTVRDDFNVLNNYCGIGNDVSALRFISVEDTTFVVNPKVKVQKGTNTSPAKPLKAMVFVKQTDFGKEFKINVEGTEVSYTTPDGSSSSHSLQVGTDYVAEQLAAQLTTAGKTNIIVSGNVIIIDLVTPAGVLEVSDGLGNRGLIGVKDTVNAFEDLPDQTINNFVVKVVNTAELDADDYYVRFETDSGTDTGTGVWVETVAPDLEISLEQQTMPVVFKFDEANQQILCGYEVWDDRNAGDDDTNPFPSFVDSYINDLFIFQDRLGFVTDTFCILSSTSNYFNFFLNSVITITDNDFIDVGVNSYDSYKLHSAVPWNEVLVLCSRDKQFILRSNSNALTPKSVAINQSSSYKSIDKVRPKTAGASMLFGSNNGENSNIYEMYIIDYTNTDARNTTSHVSNYIPKNIKSLEVLESYNMACMLSSEDNKTIYVYQYLFNGSEKLQNCYHKWTFNFEEIFSFKFIDNDLYIVCKINDKLAITKLEINDIQKDVGMEYKVHLDKRVNEESAIISYDKDLDETSMILPFFYNDPQFVTREYNAETGLPSGFVLEIKENQGNTIIFDGNLTSVKFYVGEKYNQYLKHSTMTSINPQTGNVDIGGTVKVIAHTLTYSNTGYFKASVERDVGQNRDFTFYSKTLNDYQNDFEQFKVKSGVFKYTVKGENTQVCLTINNDSHLPCNIQSSNYDYRFYKQTR